MSELMLEALLDSLKVFGFALILYVLLSFIENKIALFFQRHTKMTPLLGAGCGLIPQCGISVVAADLYHKEHVTAGTLLAIFFACSDEALPLLLTSRKAIYVLPLLAIKFVFGFLLGYLVDFFVHKKDLRQIEEEVHIGCCHHEIDAEEEKPLHQHLWHPLIHSFKIFIYVFIVNVLFGLLLYFIGEDQVISFLETNVYLGPLFASLVGLVPNCASSVILTELFLKNGLSFGALITGLCINAGLGFVYLLKFKEERLKVLKIMLALFLYSILIGYAVLFIMQAFSLN